MPTKLKNLKVKRVALVDAGANPDAYVRFAKNKVSPQPVDETNEQSIVKRMLSAISKAFGLEPDPVQKDAHTFAEGNAVRDYEKVYYDEICMMDCAFRDSVYSIMMDAEKTDAEKEAMLRQSLSEFNTAFSNSIGRWSRAESADDVSKVENVDSLLEKMRDDLTRYIEKKAPTTEPKDGADDDDEDADDNDTIPSVKKGVSDMIFDTSKMTPEEVATYEDLAKRYGSEEPAPVPSSPAATEPTAGDDVNKGINPVVAAELESLRKFREDFENRQYIEVAKKYTLLGKKPEELGPVLKSLKDAGGSAYDDMIGVLDSSLALVEKSGTFDEIGKRGHSTVDDAWGKIETAAQEIIKSKPDMRYSDAIDAACIQHPELVEEYEKSRR